VQTRLLRGWNTWNNPSLLSHVLMPEGLALNIVFRNNKGGPYWLRDSYVRRAPVPADRETIKVGRHTLDGRFTELTLSWMGITAHIASATVGDDIVILYTPDPGANPERTLVLETAMLWNRPGQLVPTAGGIEAHVGNRRVFVGATEPDRGVKLPLGSPYLSFRPDREVGFFAGQRRSLEEIKALVEKRRAEVDAESAKYGRLAEAHQAMQSALAWNLFYEAQGNRAVTSVSRVWNEAWGGYILFDWDTYFAGLMMGLENKDLGYANVIAITSEATQDGFVPNVAAAHGIKSNDRSQPPVGGLVTKMLYDRFGDRWFVEAVFDRLLRWNLWWDRHRNNQGYLSWGSDPHPVGMEGHTKHAAMLESGLDNSPLFEEAEFDPKTHLLQLADVGLMSMYVADCKALAALADVLGRSADAAGLRSRATQYSEKTQTLWDPEAGVFRDRDLKTGLFSSHLAPTNFYPLLARIATPLQAQRMVQEHLLNPKEFGGPWMLPSISRNDPAFPDNEYWRGRVWAPMNLLVYLGLRGYELPEAQKLLADSSINLLLKDWRTNRHVHENYNSETGEGDDVVSSDSFYSWGGLLGFIGLMEEGHFPFKPL